MLVLRDSQKHPAFIYFLLHLRWFFSGSEDVKLWLDFGVAAWRGYSFSSPLQELPGT